MLGFPHKIASAFAGVSSLEDRLFRASASPLQRYTADSAPVESPIRSTGNPIRCRRPR
jgi:hypothetical protein